MTSIFVWIMLVIATERSTELVVTSKIFEPIRFLIKRWVYPSESPPPDTVFQRFKVKIDYLLNCGYCVSVWTGGIFALFAEQYLESPYANWFVSALFLHGMANLYHVCYELLKRGRIKTHDVVLKVVIDDDGSEQVVEEQVDNVV